VVHDDIYRHGYRLVRRRWLWRSTMRFVSSPEPIRTPMHDISPALFDACGRPRQTGPHEHSAARVDEIPGSTQPGISRDEPPLASISTPPARRPFLVLSSPRRLAERRSRNGAKRLLFREGKKKKKANRKRNPTAHTKPIHTPSVCSVAEQRLDTAPRYAGGFGAFPFPAPVDRAGTCTAARRDNCLCADLYLDAYIPSYMCMYIIQTASTYTYMCIIQTADTYVQIRRDMVTWLQPRSRTSYSVQGPRVRVRLTLLPSRFPTSSRRSSEAEGGDGDRSEVKPSFSLCWAAG